MAKIPPPPADAPADASLAPVRVRVLTACAYGQANDVVFIPAGEVDAAKADSLVDDNRDAVAYALTLQA